MKQKMSKILVKTKNPTKLKRMTKRESSEGSKKRGDFLYIFLGRKHASSLCARIRPMDGWKSSRKRRKINYSRRIVTMRITKN